MSDESRPGHEVVDELARKIVRIGGASGFWGDSSVGAPQLVASGMIDYLVFDYLAETTMAILAAARARKPELGYATDFVDTAMRHVLPEVMKRGIKVIANAGGVHPQGCADALRALAASMGLSPRIAVVEGDDVCGLMPSLRDEDVRDMFTGEPLPPAVLSANAYLGAFPVARALQAGADIVITGRGVDSAVTLGALIHEFGWTPGDHDRLAGGSLAGHIIECGCQATGGLFTDWRRVPDWAGIGYPIIECTADGSFELTKAPGTGGLIDRACVIEQMLYEIGDPGAYLLPDVSCDFRRVIVEQVSPERVRVSGAQGRAPAGTYKVSATQRDGYRCAGMAVIVGIDALAKARRTAEAIIERTRGIFSRIGLADYTHVQIEFFGCESLYGANARTQASREVMLRLVVDHDDKRALEIFAREIAPAGTSWSPGTTMPSGGRSAPSPLVKPLSFLLDKARVPVRVRLDERAIDVDMPTGSQAEPASTGPAARLADPDAWIDPAGEAQVEVPLVHLAWARSGDKGNISNIGVIARRPEYLALLWARLTPDAVRRYFAHMVQGRVDRFYLPGTASLNLVMHDALGGGGPASARFDPLGKGNAQILLDMAIRVPASWASHDNRSAQAAAAARTYAKPSTTLLARCASKTSAKVLEGPPRKANRLESHTDMTSSRLPTGPRLAPWDHPHPINPLILIRAMKKLLLACTAVLALTGNAFAQVGKAASEAADAAEHKIDQKRADSDAKKSGPIGKTVNNVKSGYHKNRSKNSAEKAKSSLKKATS